MPTFLVTAYDDEEGGLLEIEVEATGVSAEGGYLCFWRYQAGSKQQERFRWVRAERCELKDVP